MKKSKGVDSLLEWTAKIHGVIKDRFWCELVDKELENLQVNLNTCIVNQVLKEFPDYELVFAILLLGRFTPSF